MARESVLFIICNECRGSGVVEGGRRPCQACDLIRVRPTPYTAGQLEDWRLRAREEQAGRAGLADEARG